MTVQQGLGFVRRGLLIFLTVLAISLITNDLISSWSRPQFQNSLELYQSQLLLQASEYQPQDPQFSVAASWLKPDEAMKSATKVYEDAYQAAKVSPDAQAAATLDTTSNSRSASQSGKTLTPKLALSLGLLQAEQQRESEAQTYWEAAIAHSQSPDLAPLQKTAQILTGLWSPSPTVPADAETTLAAQLDGWFRYRALSRLYATQRRSQAETALNIAEQTAAQRALTSLVLSNGLPLLSVLVGLGIWLVLLGQWLVQRQKSLLSQITELTSWSTPWDGETIWQVLIFGFFAAGQLVLPVVIAILRQTGVLDPKVWGSQAIAGSTLASYIAVAVWALIVLYVSIRPFRPLPDGWFQISFTGSWLKWGLGGYCAAFPIVALISALNQLVWQGKGGSNPILPIALENRDGLAIALFVVTAAIAAPIFEEILFRGFLMASLTRYLPAWGAIVVSSLIFALAHLSLSEVLPLTALGIMLGLVYMRTRNLLTSMLLHSLWNSGTLLSLVILGGGMG